VGEVVDAFLIFCSRRHREGPFWSHFSNFFRNFFGQLLMTFVTRLLRIKENRNRPRVKMTMQCEKASLHRLSAIKVRDVNRQILGKPLQLLGFM